jgi:hypothetical protein
VDRLSANLDTLPTASASSFLSIEMIIRLLLGVWIGGKA